MPPPSCNKCKTGEPSSGDSWCIACSALELSQSLFKQSWLNKGVRRTAEEVALSASRVINALRNLDRGLTEHAEAAPSGVASKARGPHPRDRSPVVDNRPPLRRAPTPPPAPPPRRTEDHRDRRRDSPPRLPAIRRVPIDEEDEESEESFEEEEEEDRCTRDSYQEVGAGAPVVKAESIAGDLSPGSRRPPEPEGLPPAPRGHRGGDDHRTSHHHSHGSGKKRKKNKGNRRGGTKHQRRYREVEDPLRRSHRKLSGEIAELAPSFREGLEEDLASPLLQGWSAPIAV